MTSCYQTKSAGTVIRSVLGLCFMLVLSICSSCSDKGIKLNSSGEIEGIQWGTTADVVKKQYPDAVMQGTNLEIGNTLFGLPVKIKLFFSGDNDLSPILYGAEIVFSENFDYNKICSEMDSIFGPRETSRPTLNGETADLTEESFFWHSKERLSDLLSEQDIVSMGSEIDVQWMTYIANAKYLVEITLSEENKSMYIDAGYYVDARK